jgi:DNA-binding NarL/FixJ family response regulator
MAKTFLIVDDHAGFRAQARALLDLAGYEVVGEAEDGASALAAASERPPDVVLLDVQLPDATGFNIARSLRARPSPPAVILISSREASDYGHAIDGCGASGFVWKGDLSAAALEIILGGAP